MKVSLKLIQHFINKEGKEEIIKQREIIKKVKLISTITTKIAMKNCMILIKIKTVSNKQDLPHTLNIKIQAFNHNNRYKCNKVIIKVSKTLVIKYKKYNILLYAIHS